MSSRLNTCPRCKSFNVETVMVHNPDTQEMNAKASLRCRECGCVWDGAVTSDYHRRMRQMGFVK